MLLLCLLGEKNPLYLQKANYFLLQISVNNVCILESLGGLQDCISPRMLLYLYLLYFVLSSWSPTLTLMYSTQRNVTFCDFYWFCLQLHVQFPWIISCSTHMYAFGGKSGSHFSWVEWYYSKLDSQSNCFVLVCFGRFFLVLLFCWFVVFFPLYCAGNFQTICRHMALKRIVHTVPAHVVI